VAQKSSAASCPEPRSAVHLHAWSLFDRLIAIPTWLTNPELVGSPAAAEADLDDASETFERLSDPVRLEILTTLHRSADPIRYADLQASLSIRDNGRLNYHLRQLDDLIYREDGRYALSDRGERLIRQVAAAGLPPE
jgi:DNA-binding transcriptional ArsR family regulator